MKKKIILFTVMTICITVFSYFFNIINNDLDELWNYGFSYNIAKGAIPYRDFNMVVMPLYSLIMAIPLKIIGNNLFVFHLFNAIFISFMLTIIDDNKWLNTICMCLFIMIIQNVYGYNSFIMILLILILYLNNSEYKYKNEIIGLLLGCVLATKQNMGVVLFIPYILHSKQKLKSICFYLIPITMVGVYLILNNALIECIDYCFLGLKNFTSNFIVVFPGIIVVLVIIIIYLILQYIKTKDINYLYLAFFQIINYPLMDVYHFYVSMIPIAYYIMVKENNKYINIVFLIFSITIMCVIYFPNLFSHKYHFSNIDKYKYRNILKEAESYSDKIASLIKDNPNSKVFIFSNYAYFTKISLDLKLDKFDLINKGNMGAHEEKYIEDIETICKKKNCLFILDEELFDAYSSQTNPIIRDYVIHNYDYCGKITNKESLYCKKNTE